MAPGAGSKKMVESVLVKSLAEVDALIAFKVEEQKNAPVPEVMTLSLICSPEFLFEVKRDQQAGTKSSLEALEETDKEPPLPANIDPSLGPNVMTAADVLKSSREPAQWRNLTKYVTENVVNHVKRVEGSSFTYRNRDKYSLKDGVRMNYVCK
jgi:hypothetical protein